MIGLIGSKGLKFKGCCWDGAEYNLDKYDIHLHMRLNQEFSFFSPKYIKQAICLELLKIIIGIFWAIVGKHCFSSMKPISLFVTCGFFPLGTNKQAFFPFIHSHSFSFLKARSIRNIVIHDIIKHVFDIYRT